VVPDQHIIQDDANLTVGSAVDDRLIVIITTLGISRVDSTKESRNTANPLV